MLVRKVQALLIEKGYQATSLSDIMTASGLSKGAVYHHFPHKEAIAMEVLRDDGARLIRLIEQSDPLKSASSVRALLERLAHLSASDRGMGQVVFTLGTELANHSGRLASAVRAQLANVRAALQQNGAPPDLVYASLVMAHGLDRLGHDRPFATAAEMISPALRSDEDRVDVT